MIRALRVELARLRWRRAVVVLLGLGVLAPLVVLGSVAWDTRPASDAETARAERQATRDAERPYVERDLERCQRNPQDYVFDDLPDTSDADAVRAACEESVVPQPEWYLSRSVLDVSEELEGTAVAVTVLVAVLMLLVGTTFAGHDWNTGSVTNQLIFEPGRLRLWTAKALAVVVTAAVVAAVLLALYWCGLLGLASSRDLPVGGDVVRNGTLSMLRAGGLAVATGLAGYALAMLFRSTVATLGLLLGTAIAVPVVVTLLAFPGYLEVLPQNNVIGWVQGSAAFVDYERDECNLDSSAPGCTVVVTAGEAGLRGGLGLALLVVGSAASFRRRDVG